MTAINILKEWFSTGKKPTAAQFAEWLDSFRHKSEKISITEVENLQTTLVNKASHADIATAKAQIIGGSPDDTLLKLYNKIVALQALINGDDVNLDSIKEISDYIKANKDLIDQVTDNKVSTADIYNALDYTVAGKVLDARQGKALKDLCDSLTAITQNHETRIAALEAGGGGSSINVVQTTGQSTTDVMSQKAVTDAVLTAGGQNGADKYVAEKGLIWLYDSSTGVQGAACDIAHTPGGKRLLVVSKSGGCDVYDLNRQQRETVGYSERVNRIVYSVTGLQSQCPAIYLADLNELWFPTSTAGNIVIINADTGAVKTTVTTGVSAAFHHVAYTQAARVVWFGNDGGTAICGVNADTRQTVYNTPLVGSAAGMAAISGEHLYITHASKQMCINATTLTVVYDQSIADYEAISAVTAKNGKVYTALGIMSYLMDAEALITAPFNPATGNNSDKQLHGFTFGVFDRFWLMGTGLVGYLGGSGGFTPNSRALFFFNPDSLVCDGQAVTDVSSTFPQIRYKGRFVIDAQNNTLFQVEGDTAYFIKIK